MFDQSRVQSDSGKLVFDAGGSSVATPVARNGNARRAKDQEFFSEFFPSLTPIFSKGLGSVYWKGRIALIDGSHAEVLAIQQPDGEETYAITVKDHKGCGSPRLQQGKKGVVLSRVVITSIQQEHSGGQEPEVHVDRTYILYKDGRKVCLD